MMRFALRFSAFGILMVASLNAANSGLFTSCKNKCTPERCTESSERKADCKKKCPKEIACQQVMSNDERDDLNYKLAEVTHPKAAKILGPQESPEEKKQRLLKKALQDNDLYGGDVSSKAKAKKPIETPEEQAEKARLIQKYLQ